MSLLLLALAASCVPPQGVDRTAAPHTQDTIKSHLEALARRVQQRLQPETGDRMSSEDEIMFVEEYFMLTIQESRTGSELRNIAILKPEVAALLQGQLDQAQQRRTEMRSRVESIISRQVGEALAEAGLTAPLGAPAQNWLFPPAEFFFMQPPFVLVTSPRDRIEIDRSYLLGPRLTLADMQEIERRVEDTGASALVERTAGFSLFPAWVSDADSLSRTLDIVAHEWMHAYLFLFYPLGRGYFQDYEMRTINETVSSMVGREIGEAVHRRYYAPVEPPPSPAVAAAIAAREADFAGHMRRITPAVRAMLSDDRVDEAEAYMEAELEYLRGRGFGLRRLNQAYLALHGSYADEVGFESPIGAMLRDLRASSPTLGDFVRQAGTIASYADLENLIR